MPRFDGQFRQALGNITDLCPIRVAITGEANWLAKQTRKRNGPAKYQEMSTKVRPAGGSSPASIAFCELPSAVWLLAIRCRCLLLRQ